MRDKLSKKVLYTLLKIFGAALLLIFIINETFIGRGLGRMIDDILVSYSYDPETGAAFESVVDWPRFKLFFVVVTIVLLLITSGVTMFVVRTFVERELKNIAKTIPEFMAGGDTNLLEDYPDLGFQLSEIRKNNLQTEELYRKESQRTKDMITYLAHDLKTPLASMTGYLNLLRDIQDLPLAKREKYLDIALAKGDRLEELINELFDVTRFALDSMTLYITKVPVKLFLNQMAEEFYPMLQSKNQRITLTVPDDLMMTADSDKIARVINNLLKNAVAYGRNDSDIRITAQQSADARQLVMAIENDGQTIPKEELDLIFEKFYRLDKSRGTENSGGGLGLAIAKEIVLAHKGQIRAESEGGVTTFSLSLPILNET